MSETMTGFVLSGLSPDAYITVFACVEELRAFPERMFLIRRSETEHLAFARIMRVRNVLQRVRWLAYKGGVLAVALEDSQLDSSTARREVSEALVVVIDALKDFEFVVPVTWRVEWDAIECMIEQLGQAHMATVSADEVGTL